MPLRASVTADAVNTNPGDPAPILIDGADTACTANGLQNYTPRPGDRLLVDKVGGTLEVIQFINTGSVPFVATYRQDTDPALTGTVPDGAIWFDTGNGSAVNTRENGAWVTMQYGSPALDTTSVQRAIVGEGFVLEGGIAVLSNGATNPTTAPTISYYYPSYNSTWYSAGTDRSAFFAGMEVYAADTTKWISPTILFGTGLTLTDKATGADHGAPYTTTPGWCANFYAYGGIAHTTDGYYWLLGFDNDRSGDWYIYAINDSTYAKAFELRLGGSGTFHGYYPRIVSNGPQMGMIWIPSSGNLMLRWYDVQFGASIGQTGTDITLKTGVGMQSVGDAVCDTANTGLTATVLFVALYTNASTYPDVMCWSSITTTTAVRSVGADFLKPNGSRINAMGYDSTTGHFTIIDSTGVARFTSTVAEVASSSVSVTARYTYYDGDTGNYAGAIGSGTVIINGVDVSGTASTTHETGYSPTATDSAFPRRAWPRITVGAAPDVNNLDATLVDRANRQGVYVAIGGGTMWQLGYTTVGQTVMDGWETFPSSGTPATHDFSTAQVSLGEFESAALRLDGTPKAYIDGSGKANLDGLIPPGSMMMWAGATAPEGWLLCNGAAVSRTTYADLYAVCGTSYGLGDGTTTFNLPDLRGRYPLGLAASGAFNALGAYETQSAGSTTPPGAGDTGRLDHRHTHAITQGTNFTKTGSGTGDTGANTDSQGVNSGNFAYHGTLAVNFIIKV